MYDPNTYQLNIPVKSCMNCKASNENAKGELVCGSIGAGFVLVHQNGLCKNFKSKVLEAVKKEGGKK